MSIFGGLGIFEDPMCPSCGAVVRDVAIHQVWHDSINMVIRRVLVPDLTDEQWRALITDPDTEAKRQTLIELARVEQQVHAEMKQEET